MVPGYDFIADAILIQLPRKRVVTSANLINVFFPLIYIPDTWKKPEIIMNQKPVNTIKRLVVPTYVLTASDIRSSRKDHH